VVVKNVNLDVATDLHVFGIIEIIPSVCLSVCLSVCISLYPYACAHEQAAGYHSHSPFKNYPTTGECQVDTNIPATKIGALRRGDQT
jgi:hypothetical protein